MSSSKFARRSRLQMSRNLLLVELAATIVLRVAKKSVSKTSQRSFLIGAALCGSLAFTGAAHSQAFNATPSTQDGSVTYNRATPGIETITINGDGVIGDPRTKIAWTTPFIAGDFLPADNTATFQRTNAGLAVLNRINGTGSPVTLNGTVIARVTSGGSTGVSGLVAFESNRGFVVGPTANFSVGDLGFEGPAGGPVFGSNGTTTTVDWSGQLTASSAGPFADRFELPGNGLRLIRADFQANGGALDGDAGTRLSLEDSIFRLRATSLNLPSVEMTRSSFVFDGGTASSARTLTQAFTLNDLETVETAGARTLTLAGPIGGAGMLNVAGSGTTILSGANTYSGGTTIISGELRVNGSVTSGVTVQGGGALSGIGSIGGAVIIQSGGTLSAGQGPGTLTVGSLNLNAGSTSVFELGAPGVVGGVGNDLVNVTGGLTLGGTLSVNAPSAGYYRLFNYGTLAGSFASVSGSTQGTATVVTNVANQVNLSVAGAGQRLQFWDGTDLTGNGVVNGGAGIWNAANTNWTGAPGQAGVNDQWRSSVGVFAGAAGGAVSVIGTQAFDTLQFSTNGYVLNGGQLQLAGAANTGTFNTDSGTTATINSLIVDGLSTSLTKVGQGTLILSSANTYAGGTTISSGTLQIGNGGTTGSIVGNVADNATLAFNRSDAVIFGGVISGTGAVNQIGAGTTTLTAASTYTGPTTITAGTLAIAATGSLTSNVINNAAFNNAGSVTGTLTNAATGSNAGLITGTVANSGAFTNTASGVVSGRLTNTAGNTINSGVLNGGLSNSGGGSINTGYIASGVIVSGGSFTQTAGLVSGGLANSAMVNANGGAINGAVFNNAGGSFNAGGAVSGDSTFANAANATLAVAETGSYTLQGRLTNAGMITVAAGGTLTDLAGITNAAGGSITVAVGGTVRDDLDNASMISNSGAYVANVASNTGAGNITNTSTGTWTGNVLGNAAAITNNGSWTGNVVSNTGTIVNKLIWNGTISNAGTVNNAATGRVSGLLTNTAGVIANDGALNGGALINGGMLVGSGSVSNLTIGNGGTFVPGNGTPGSSMAVTGNLAFLSGALYLVQLNPATSTFANVTGTAMLTGSAGAAFLAGNYVAKKYTILTAGGGVSGTFASFSTVGVPSGFNASLSYGANNVFLDLALNFVPPPGSGLSGNQQNVANSIVNFFNTNGGISLVFGGLTAAGLTQISGELPTASQQATFDSMNLFVGLITDPFVGGRGEGASAPGGASSYADEAMGYADKRRPSDALAAIYRKAPPMAPTFEQRWSLWAAGYGGSRTSDGNAVLGSNTATVSIYGTAVGADYRFSPNTLAGFAMAGGGTNFGVANGLGSGRSDLFQAGAFLRHTAGSAYITAALAYGWQDVTTDRTVAVAGVDRLRGRFDANAWSGRVEGGYRYATAWMGFTPYAAGQFTTYALPNYAESVVSGVNTFALNYASKDVTASRSEFGFRADQPYATSNGIFTLRGRAAWAHNFNTDRNINATFQTLPGASFTVNGASQASDSVLTTASAEMKWYNGWSAAATFEGEFSYVTRSYAGKGVIRYAW